MLFVPEASNQEVRNVLPHREMYFDQTLIWLTRTW